MYYMSKYAQISFICNLYICKICKYMQIYYADICKNMYFKHMNITYYSNGKYVEKLHIENG